MEPLHDPQTADHHRSAQHERGGHHPDRLSHLLAYDDEKSQQEPPGESRVPRRTRQTRKTANNGTAEDHGQTRLEDLGA